VDVLADSTICIFFFCRNIVFPFLLLKYKSGRKVINALAPHKTCKLASPPQTSNEIVRIASAEIFRSREYNNSHFPINFANLKALKWSLACPQISSSALYTPKILPESTNSRPTFQHSNTIAEFSNSAFEYVCSYRFSDETVRQ
jgi:hypothetical protein